MVNPDDLGEVLDLIGPEVSANPMEAAKYAGIMPEWFDESDAMDWAADVSYQMADHRLNNEPAVAGVMVLGVAAGYMLGLKAAAEILNQLDDVDVLEGSDWLPHND